MFLWWCRLDCTPLLFAPVKKGKMGYVMDKVFVRLRWSLKGVAERYENYFSVIQTSASFARSYEENMKFYRK